MDALITQFSGDLGLLDVLAYELLARKHRIMDPQIQAQFIYIHILTSSVYSVKLRADFSVLHLIVRDYKLKHRKPCALVCVDIDIVM